MGIYRLGYHPEISTYEGTTLHPDLHLLNTLITKYRLPRQEVVSAFSTIPYALWETSVLSLNVARVDRSTAVPNFYGLEPREVETNLRQVGGLALEALRSTGGEVWSSVMGFLKGEELSPTAIIACDNLGLFIASQLQNLREKPALDYRANHVRLLKQLQYSRMSADELSQLLSQTVTELKGEDLPPGTARIKKPNLPIIFSFDPPSGRDDTIAKVSMEVFVPQLPEAQEIKRITPEVLRTDSKHPQDYKLDPEDPLGLMERFPLIGDLTLRAVARHIRTVAEGKNRTQDYLSSFAMSPADIARCNFQLRAKHHPSTSPPLPHTMSNIEQD